ncbi:MAG: hypothetical protein GXO48_08135 [Chlorobi bacterium]|nr:hypothetical protein [Chlorobiota bacterium]
MRKAWLLLALFGLGIKLNGQSYIEVLPRKQEVRDRYSPLFNWNAIVNPYTHLPRYAFGNPVVVEGSSYGEKALASAQKLGLSTSILRHTGTFTTRSGKTYVNFVQVVNDTVEVMFSRASFRFNNNGELFAVVMDVFPYQPNNKIIPLTSAELNSLNSFQDANIELGDLKVLPILKDGGYELRYVYEIHIRRESPPLYIYNLVDAQTREVLYEQDRILDATKFTTSIYDNGPSVGTTTNKALARATVNSGIYSYITSQSGTITATLPSNFTVRLSGPRVTVYDYNNGSPVMVSFSQSQLTATASGYHVPMSLHPSAINTFVAVVEIFDTTLYWWPSVTVFNGSIPAYVDRNDGSCNAYYDYSSINFFYDDGTCYASGQFIEIAYHEFAHGINHKAYIAFGDNGMDNSALHEGYSDVWTIFITGDPVLGEGFFKGNPAFYIRRYDGDPKRYPDDVDPNYPHATGEIIAGAWWDFRQLTDPYTAFRVFTEHYMGTPDAPDGQEGVLYQDCLMEALIADDDDGDLTNGTPNQKELLCAFARHGIYPPGNTSGFPLTSDNVHKTDEVIGNTTGVKLSAFTNGIVDTVWMFYRLAGQSTWDSLMAQRVSGDSFAVNIPVQKPAIVEYYFNYSTCQSKQTMPQNVLEVPANIPYVRLLGYELKEHVTVSTARQWLIGAPDDDATTGIWTITTPVASYLDPASPSRETMIQPGYDRTGDNIYAVTGAYATEADQPGQDDIDNGKTTLTSPAIDLSQYEDPVITYWRWFSNEMGASPLEDYWRVYISNNDTTWVLVEETRAPDRSWRLVAIRVKNYIQLSNKVRLKFVAEDIGNGSVVEAALDGLKVWDVPQTVSAEKPYLARSVYYDRFSRKLFVPENSRVQVMSTDGRLVFNSIAEKGYVYLDLVPGVYIAKIEHSDKVFVIKFVE